MRTIGKHLPASLPHGDYTAICSFCGVLRYRSELVRDGAGNMVCPDEGPGLDVNTLTEEVEADNEPWVRTGNDARGETPSTDVAPNLTAMLKALP